MPRRNSSGDLNRWFFRRFFPFLIGGAVIGALICWLTYAHLGGK